MAYYSNRPLPYLHTPHVTIFQRYIDRAFIYRVPLLTGAYFLPFNMFKSILIMILFTFPLYLQCNFACTAEAR